MIWFILGVAAAAGWWWYKNRRERQRIEELLNPTDPADYLPAAREKRERERRAQELADRPPEEIAQGTLDKAIARCMDKHRFATSALIYMAASDGRVSREELRIIIGFCQSNGTDISSSWEDAAKFLNAGATIRSDIPESVAASNIANLGERPIAYRASVLGAAEAIVAMNKTTTAAKSRLLEQIRQMVR